MTLTDTLTLVFSVSMLPGVSSFTLYLDYLFQSRHRNITSWTMDWNFWTRGPRRIFVPLIWWHQEFCHTTKEAANTWILALCPPKGRVTSTPLDQKWNRVPPRFGGQKSNPYPVSTTWMNLNSHSEFEFIPRNEITYFGRELTWLIKTKFWGKVPELF